MYSLKINFGGGYLVEATHIKNNINIIAKKNGVECAIARIISDSVDVSCVTKIFISDDHINNEIKGKINFGEMFVKFLIKFPFFVRKPEFRFFMNVPENLSPIMNKFSFLQNSESSFNSQFMVKKSTIFPENSKKLLGIKIADEISDNDIEAVFSLLKKNAYWQSHLSIERLHLLIKSSFCFLAIYNGVVVGFARVLSDGTFFASIWDVVVKKEFQGKGIGTDLMEHIFSKDRFKEIENWMLFTDTASGLYKKFGFVFESSQDKHSFLCKIRIQDKTSEDMETLIKRMDKDLDVSFNSEEIFNFLFGEDGKRANLLPFWDEALSRQKDLSDPCKPKQLKK